MKPVQASTWRRLILEIDFTGGVLVLQDKDAIESVRHIWWSRNDMRLVYVLAFKGLVEEFPPHQLGAIS